MNAKKTAEMPDSSVRLSVESYAKQSAKQSAKSKTGFAALANGEDFDIVTAVGGKRGIAESVIPGFVFVVLFAFSRNLGMTVIISAVVAGLQVLVRLFQKQSFMGALSGIFSVGICLIWAWASKDARNYYLPGFITNAVWTVLLLISVAIKLPGIALIVEYVRKPVLSGFGKWIDSWKNNRELLRAYSVVTWIWIALFALRLTVQVPLYLSNRIEWLGTARLVMSTPLFAATVWASWLMLFKPMHNRKIAEQEAAETQASQSESAQSESVQSDTARSDESQSVAAQSDTAYSKTFE